VGTKTALLAAVLLCGCGHKQDSRDARIAKLETNYNALALTLSNLKAVIDVMETNVMSGLEDLRTNQAEAMILMTVLDSFQ